MIAVAVRLVPPYFIVGKETFYRFFERDTMCSKLIPLEVIFEVSRYKAMPVDHLLFYPVFSLRTLCSYCGLTTKLSRRLWRSAAPIC